MDSVLAVRAPQFDLIIGGHSHTTIETPRRYGDVVVTQTGSKLKHAGLTTLTFKNGKLKHIDNRLIPLDTGRHRPNFRRWWRRSTTIQS